MENITVKLAWRINIITWPWWALVRWHQVESSGILFFFVLQFLFSVQLADWHYDLEEQKMSEFCLKFSWRLRCVCKVNPWGVMGTHVVVILTMSSSRSNKAKAVNIDDPRLPRGTRRGVAVMVSWTELPSNAINVLNIRCYWPLDILH